MTDATEAQEAPHPAAGAPVRSVVAVTEPGGDPDTLRAAAGLAERTGAALSVLSNVEPPSDFAALARATGLAPAEMEARLVAERRERMAGELATLFPGEAPPLHVSFGKAFVQIVRHAILSGVDIVVKAAEPLEGLERFLFASTDQHLVRKCPAAVWLRVAGAPVVPRSIVAAVDVDLADASEPETLDALNRRVVETAIALAEGPEASVHVLHAWEALGEGLVWTFASGTDSRALARRYVVEVETERRRALDALLRPYRLAGGGQPHIFTRLARGPARTVIPEQAETLSADVVVMGTVARTGLGGVIIGNTAEDVVNSVACSVVTIKPEGFVSPIAPDPAEDAG